MRSNSQTTGEIDDNHDKSTNQQLDKLTESTLQQKNLRNAIRLAISTVLTSLPGSELNIGKEAFIQFGCRM